MAIGERLAGESGGTARGVGWQRWRGVLVQSVRDLLASDGPEVAAALAFYGLISLFPLLLTAAAVASYLEADAAWAAARISELLGEFVPRGEVEVEQIVVGAIDRREQVGMISLLVLIASGRRVLGALAKALNKVSDVDHRRDSMARRVAVELAMLTGVGALFGLALSSGALLGALQGAIGGGSGMGRVAWEAVLAGVRGALLLATFLAIYTFVPRGTRDWRAALIGAAAATALFLIARSLFLFWVDRLWENLSLIYGPLAVGTVLLLWAWYVALITLFGGALASHVKVMAIEGASAGEAKRRHVDAIGTA